MGRVSGGQNPTAEEHLQAEFKVALPVLHAKWSPALAFLFAACNTPRRMAMLRAMDNVQWITFLTPSLARRLPCEAQGLLVLGWRKEAR